MCEGRCLEGKGGDKLISMGRCYDFVISLPAAHLYKVTALLRLCPTFQATPAYPSIHLTFIHDGARAD